MTNTISESEAFSEDKRRARARSVTVVTRYVLIATVAAGVAIYPFLADAYSIHIATMVFIYAIMALGLNVQLGELGLVNMGFAGFFAIGAYTSAILNIQGVPFVFSVGCAIVLAFVVGAILGSCSIKASGDYLALVTMAFGLIVQQFLINVPSITNGTDGIRNIPFPNIFGFDLGSSYSVGAFLITKDMNFYFFSFLALGLTIIVTRRCSRSWIGRAWAGVREDSLATGCFGLNVQAFRIKSFAFGAAFGGLGGALFAHKIGYISPDDFGLFFSVTLLSMVILGGMGNWVGVILGTAVIVLLPEQFRALQDYRYLVFGICLLALLIFRPGGLIPRQFRRV